MNLRITRVTIRCLKKVLSEDVSSFVVVGPESPDDTPDVVSPVRRVAGGADFVSLGSP